MRLFLILIAAFVLLLAVGFAAWMLLGTRSGKRPEGPEQVATGTAADDPGAEWRAEVKVEQLSERNPDYEVNRLTVVLRNAKGKETETPDAQFELPGVPLEYRVGQGNYYDRHPYYRLLEDSGFSFAADAPYEIAVKRAGGPASPFATLRTPKPMSPDDFRLPATHPHNRDLVLSWTGLSQPAEVVIYKTHRFIDENGNQAFEGGSPYSGDALRYRIGSGGLPLRQGSITVPSPYLATAAGRSVSALGIEITASNTGNFLQPVLKQSTVTALRKVVLRVDVSAP